jgi:hypothetical protein
MNVRLLPAKASFIWPPFALCSSALMPNFQTGSIQSLS